MQVVECSGNPYDMGRQYGEQAREGIRHNIEKYVTPPDVAWPDYVHYVRCLAKATGWL